MRPESASRGRQMAEWPTHGTIDGPIVIIGFGSIGKGTLPLIERHFRYDKSRMVVLDPDDSDREILDKKGIRFMHKNGGGGGTTADRATECPPRTRAGGVFS